MKGASEPLENNNGQYLHIVGIQTVQNKEERMEALSKGKGAPVINVKTGESLDINASSFYIENGKRIDEETGAILKPLKPGQEEKIIKMQIDRAKQIGDKKLESRLSKVLTNLND